MKFRTAYFLTPPKHKRWVRIVTFLTIRKKSRKYLRQNVFCNLQQSVIRLLPSPSSATLRLSQQNWVKKLTGKTKIRSFSFSIEWIFCVLQGEKPFIIDGFLPGLNNNILCDILVHSIKNEAAKTEAIYTWQQSQ